MLALPIALLIWGTLQFALNIDEGGRRPLDLHWWDAALCVGSIGACGWLNWRIAVALTEEEQENALWRLLKVAEQEPGAILRAVPQLTRLTRGRHGRLAFEVLSRLEGAGTHWRDLPVACHPERTPLTQLPVVGEGRAD